MHFVPVHCASVQGYVSVHVEHGVLPDSDFSVQLQEEPAAAGQEDAPVRAVQRSYRCGFLRSGFVGLLVYGRGEHFSHPGAPDSGVHALQRVIGQGEVLIRPSNNGVRGLPSCCTVLAHRLPEYVRKRLEQAPGRHIRSNSSYRVRIRGELQ